MQSKKITDILLYIAIAILLFGSGYKIGEYQSKVNLRKQITYSIFTTPGKNSFSDVPDTDFSLFWTTWEKIEQKYVDRTKIDPKKMYYGAIKGLVASLEDPYTFFLTPDENKQAKNDLGGNFEGIGAQLGLKENRVVVVAPIKNSPAEQKGVRAGDFINKVDGQSTRGWTLPQTVSKIRGQKDTEVKLTLERDQKEFDVSIKRQQIHVPSVELTYENGVNCDGCQIAYLKLNQFGDNTNDEWNKATTDIARKWQAKEIAGMVLDVRDNPGGYLDSSVFIASEFLPEDTLVVKQESKVTPTRNYYVQRQGKLLDIPLAVLINQGSASASEILSGALRDHNRAKIVGMKSFGKGSVQEALDLENGAGLHVTIAKWVLPKGEWINGKGIEPQYKVENAADQNNTITKATDQQLQKALELAVTK